LFSNGDWLIDSDGDRRFDASIRFGQTGDVPVVGDFNGDGVDELAVYRPGATDAEADAPRVAENPVESPVDSQVAESAEGAALQR
ncbi:MAG: FG-GAP repeat protein, partial [Thermoguttaceae bacterium]|nr:FG-GAP repeat protein [Thermoguttaceae bacterium]